jgi:hypothetical protein
MSRWIVLQFSDLSHNGRPAIGFRLRADSHQTRPGGAGFARIRYAATRMSSIVTSRTGPSDVPANSLAWMAVIL